MRVGRVLVVEDEPVIRSSLRRLLERNDYEVLEAESVEEACRQDLASLDLIISDLRLPGEPGTAMIDRAQATPVLIMTSYASLRSAVDSMKKGAVDYIAKPFDHEDMLAAVAETIGKKNAGTGQAVDRKAGAGGNGSSPGASGMIGESPAMMRLFSHIDRVGPTDTTVLVGGESGTGKELVARAVHAASRRSNKPMVSVNCAAIPETLIESELFGHEKGAFTGAVSTRNGLLEAADQGTLFLDEIGELPLEAQARLLRVLQEGEIRRVGSTLSHRVDVRLIAATHRDLRKMADEGSFREDLYYRLHVVELRVPPLRQRGNDIVALAQAILEKAVVRAGRTEMWLAPETLDAISKHSWRGNVRELENAIERAVVLGDENRITPVMLGLRGPASEPAAVRYSADKQEGLSMEDYFIEFVQKNQSSMSETELARRLGISRKNLWERRRRFGIPRREVST